VLDHRKKKVAPNALLTPASLLRDFPLPLSCRVDVDPVNLL
jgi:hypothetical protein